jgi:hypothetical protein
LQNGKIAKRPMREEYIRNSSWIRLLNAESWLNPLKKQVARYGAQHMAFAFFMILHYAVPFFMHTNADPSSYKWDLLIKGIGTSLCVGLFLEPYWPSWLKAHFSIYWHLSLLYCLPFSFTFLLLINSSSVEWLINLCLAITLLIVLVDWLTLTILSSIGICTGVIAYKLLFVNVNTTELNNYTWYLLIYTCIVAIFISLFFGRGRQQHFDKLAIKYKSLSDADRENKEALLETFKEKVILLHTLKRAGIKNLFQAVKLIKELHTKSQENYLASQPLQHIIRQLEDTIIPMAITLERIESRATDYLRLDIKQTTIKKLLEPLQAQMPEQPLYFQFHTKHQELICDPTSIQKVLVNSIRTLSTSENKKQLIYISLHDTKLTYPIYSLGKDYTKQIHAYSFVISTQPNIPPLEKSYQAQMSATHLPIPETSQELLLATNQRIIKAHYGYTNVDTNQQTKYDTYLYVIPVKLSDIRPRDMNDPYMELGAELIRADDTYPGAAEQEEAFLTAVQQKTSANIETIKTALEMIKWYHGPKNRNSGEPFYLHPLAVAQIVLDWNQEEATILGALLHDIVEDTAMLLENIEMMFGPEVVNIVDTVTHFESTKESFYKIKLSNHENTLMLLGVEDKRALYVKIADRIHNLRTINGHQSHTKKKQIAEEILQFFVPLARAVGWHQAEIELKDKSAAILYSLMEEN